MTLLLLLPLSLHSFFSPSLSSHSIFLFLSSETSLASTTVLNLLFTFLFLLSWGVPEKRQSWDPGNVIFGFQSCFAGHLRGSEQVQTLKVNFQLSKKLCSPGEQGSTWLQKLCMCTSHQEDQRIQLSSYSPYPVPRRRLVTMPEVGNVPAYRKYQRGRRCRKVNSWGSVILIQYEFWAVEKNHIMPGLMGHHCYYPVNMLTERRWPTKGALPVLVSAWNPSSSIGSQCLNWKSSYVSLCTVILYNFSAGAWGSYGTGGFQCTSLQQPLSAMPVDQPALLCCWYWNITHCRPHNCIHLLLPKSLDIFCRFCWNAHWGTKHSGIYVAVKQHHWSRLCLLLYYFHCHCVASRAIFSWPKFCPNFCARLLSIGFSSSEKLMSVGPSALRDLKASMQSSGYLLQLGWIFLLTLGTPNFRLQFCSLGCRVLSFLSVYSLAQGLVPDKNCWDRLRGKW